MKIKLASIHVDDQERALRFYTERLGFARKADVSHDGYRWLTVASSEDMDGTELQLALALSPAARANQQAMYEQGQPAAMFASDDLETDCARLADEGVAFRVPLTKDTWGSMAVIDDTCGNLVQLTQLSWQG